MTSMIRHITRISLASLVRFIKLISLMYPY